MNTILTTLALVLAFTISPHAASLRVLPWNDAVAEREFVIAWGKKSSEVGYLHPSARSQPVSIPGDAADLRLVASDRTTTDGKPLAIPLKFPAGVKKPLLLLLPDKNAPIGVRTHIIEDDESSFRWGTIHLINVSKHSLVFRWENQARAMPPGWKPVTAAPGGKSRNMEVLLYRKENLKEPVYSSVWEHRTDMRHLVFVVPSNDAAVGPFEFKFIPETLLPDGEGE